MIDFKGKPFYLDDGDIRWVNDTFSKMSEDDKIRQLFCLITYNDDEVYCKFIGKEVRPGGFMSRTMSAAVWLRRLRTIPMRGSTC